MEQRIIAAMKAIRPEKAPVIVTNHF